MTIGGGVDDALKGALGAGSQTYAVLVSAANRSVYFSGLLTEFFLSGGRFNIADLGAGTEDIDSKTIQLDGSWLPG